MKLTQEQTEVVRYKGPRLLVKAYAGTGKTTTLIEFAKANPKARILYLAYNRAVRDEARQKFPQNVECKTSHQLAYASVGKDYVNKLASSIKLTDILKRHEGKSWTFARDVLNTLNTFMGSADLRLLHSHFERANTNKILTRRQEQYKNEVLDAAEEIWNRMIDTEDVFPATHDCYLKLYQLNMPDLSQRYTTILFDEAQDANPVTSNIILQQECQIVLVGDPHQQIYRFRGSDNTLSSSLLESADRLYLTNSFRFGPRVAIVANALLELKGETVPVVGRGADDEVVWILPRDLGHKAVLHRTVYGVVETALQAVPEKAKVYWVGGIDSYQLDKLLDLFWFAKGCSEKIRDKRLFKEYKDYQDYEDMAKESKDLEMLRAVRILNAIPDVPAVISALRHYAIKEEELADITISTVHRAKGLEWDNVVLYDDFPDLFCPKNTLSGKERDDEINLLYVAATRAMKRLQLNAALDSAIRFVAEIRKEKVRKGEVSNAL